MRFFADGAAVRGIGEGFLGRKLRFNARETLSAVRAPCRWVELDLGEGAATAHGGAPTATES